MSHYKFLEKHLPDFWLKVFDRSLENHHAGIITAHGDKGDQYKAIWEEAGIHYYHGMMLYMLTYTDRLGDTPKHESCQWVIDNFDNYKHMLPQPEVYLSGYQALLEVLYLMYSGVTKNARLPLREIHFSESWDIALSALNKLLTETMVSYADMASDKEALCETIRSEMKEFAHIDLEAFFNKLCKYITYRSIEQVKQAFIVLPEKEEMSFDEYIVLDSAYENIRSIAKNYNIEVILPNAL